MSGGWSCGVLALRIPQGGLSGVALRVFPKISVYCLRWASGAPGHEYYQQKADYVIDVEIDDEKQVLRRRLEADRCYVMDRWYAEFALWNEIVAVG